MRPVVFTNGCFDVLHPGHLAVLKHCREIADSIEGDVCVGINSDASVRRLKGPTRPVMTWDARSDIVLALRYVDAVYNFDEDTPSKLLERLRPHTVVKGGDYTPGQVVGSEVATVVIVPFVPGFSTTSIVRRMRATERDIDIDDGC